LTRGFLTRGEQAWDNATVAMKTVGQRVDRMDQLVQLLTEDHLSLREDHVSLKKLVAELATATRKGFDRVAKQSAETDKRIDKLAVRMNESDKTMREMDKKPTSASTSW
jgi:hypothetical protein